MDNHAEKPAMPKPDARRRPRPAGDAPPVTGRQGLFARHPWVPFLLPFIVYMLVGSLEPGPPEVPPGMEGLEPIDELNFLGIRYAHYPIIYTAKIALTIAAMVYVWPGYRQFPFGITPLGILVGLVGGVLWITISELAFEQYFVDWLGPKNFLVTVLGLGERAAYRPLDQLAHVPGWAYAFLAIRFLGLVGIVPVIEEFFLRGFLMRFVMSDRWWQVPFGDVTPLAVAVGTLIPVLYHPEKLAALVWFTLVTWLMTQTRNIWDCVAAHAVTNLMLGIYVVAYGQWRLW